MSRVDGKKPQPKPQLTGRIFLWGLVDVVGMGLFSVGLVHFIHGPGAIFRSFPTNGGEAGAMIAVGGGIMVYAAGNILREMMKQPQLLDQDKEAPR